MLRRERTIIAGNLNWIILSIVFFGAGLLLTYLEARANPETTLDILTQSLKGLEELGKEVMSGSSLSGAILIALNNAGAMAAMIVFGFFIGIPPLLSLFVNGSLVGLISALTVTQGYSINFLLAALLPHGILELPAFFISGALGLKIGYHLVFPQAGMKRWQNLKINIREVTALLPLLMLLVVAAAFIEVMVTPRLIQYFFPGVQLIL